MKKFTWDDAEKCLAKRDNKRRRIIARFMAKCGHRGQRLRAFVRAFEKACGAVVILFVLCGISYADWQKWVNIGGGVIAAYAVHEAGHELAAWATGTDMDWEPGENGQMASWCANPPNDGSGLAVNAAGLAAQHLSSEVIIRYRWHNDFSDGMMIWNTVNPILYAADYWLRLGRTNEIRGHCYRGDLAGIEYYSNDSAANIFAAASVFLGLWNGYRYASTDDRPKYGLSVIRGALCLTGWF